MIRCEVFKKIDKIHVRYEEWVQAVASGGDDQMRGLKTIDQNHVHTEDEEGTTAQSIIQTKPNKNYFATIYY